MTPVLNLRRVTSGGKIIPEIDGLRFIAIFSVVAFHLYEYLRVKSGIPAGGTLGLALHHGLRGVPLFFAISGFILGRPFARHYIRNAKKPVLGHYFLRRLTRLEPPYVITILVFFVLLAGRTGIGHLFASLAYMHNLVYAAPSTISSVAWSLEVEVQFYCLIPLIAILYGWPRLLRRSLLVVLMLAGILHLLPIPDRVHLSILGWFQCFAAGLLLADFYVDDWNPKQSLLFDAAAIIILPLIFLVNDKIAWVILPALTFILYMAAFRSFAFRRVLSVPAISITGGMCYSIYLIHYQVISFAGRISHSPSFVILTSIVILAGAALTFFIVVERPCMDKDWPRKLLSR